MRRSEGIFVGVAAALAIATARRLPAAWSSGNALNHVSGAWMTLADDLSRGTFYRPLHASGGCFAGGTRFFPLPFALHGALLRLGADPLASGYAVSLAAGALLALAAFLLLRGLGLSRAPAAGFSALALAGFAGQHALSAVRGDLLPVALSALGLAALVRGRSRARVAAAACAFSLAFAAKPTSLTAPAAAVAWLALRGWRGSALALVALVTAGTIAVVAGTDILSGGRLLPLLRMGAGGGAGVHDLVRAPLRLAEQLGSDPSGLVLLLAAGAAAGVGAPGMLRAVRNGRPGSPLLLATLWLAFALATAFAVFASPGTGVNHLVELEAAGAVALGAATRAERPAVRTARVLAPAAALAGFAMALATWQADVSSSRLREIRAVVSALPPGGRVLSEDPLVPLLAGERPSILDPWMLRLAAERDPAAVLPFADCLRHGIFPSVVLFRDLADPAADAWYARGNFGPVIAGEIRRGYRRVAGFGRYHLYVPRDEAADLGPKASGEP